jgi:hypothetical protein
MPNEKIIGQTNRIESNLAKLIRVGTDPGI